MQCMTSMWSMYSHTSERRIERQAGRYTPVRKSQIYRIIVHGTFGLGSGTCTSTSTVPARARPTNSHHHPIEHDLCEDIAIGLKMPLCSPSLPETHALMPPHTYLQGVPPCSHHPSTVPSLHHVPRTSNHAGSTLQPLAPGAHTLVFQQMPVYVLFQDMEGLGELLHAGNEAADEAMERTTGWVDFPGVTQMQVQSWQDMCGACRNIKEI